MDQCLQVLDSRTGKSYTIPIRSGDYILAADVGQITAPDAKSENGDASVEVARSLRILDNGFQHTACMESSITFIDGKRGALRYRDVAIQDLFHKYVYEDVMHLIIWGALPSSKQKEDARIAMGQAAIPPKSVVDVISAFPRDSDTFPMILAGLSAFAASDKIISATRHQQKPMFHGHLEVADQAIMRTISYLATTIALIYCHKNARPFTPPETGRSLLGNLLRMLGIADPEVEKCLSKLWILYADHEMTNSTAAVLHAASTLTDPTSALVAGIVSGYGPLHGGAIDLAYEAFRQIGTPENVPRFIEGVKRNKARLFGYGHRVYKTRDPRLPLIEELMTAHRDAVDSNPLLRVAMAIDKAAREDGYFVDRGVKANADLMGCFLYTAMGFDTDMITAITILSRAPGVMAHWRESLGE
ncbi:MAG: hypothetical protein ASARMPREDX12_002522 [Alectoria sarmentosa]|nr:MAG: hypothetical protein ASARMPREDX12_002522 [Alectoria sarmentosa]